MPLSHHKDRPPRETIARARSLLAGCGLLLQEAHWRRLGQSCHAVHLCNVALPSSFANGKGVTEELALASAYAEYLERIQNLAGTPFLRTYGLMPAELARPDEVQVELGKLRESEGLLVDRLLGPLCDELGPSHRLRCTPFYDVFAGRACLLPDLVYEVLQGNGLCAGNTPTEALVQGVCEIFERHVVGELYQGKLPPLPTIPLEQVEHLPSYALVRELLAHGYRVVIKDCSLGGRLPVVATLILRSADNGYRAYFGSDPSLDVALERCLTEWFQGTGAEPSRMNHVRWAEPSLTAGEAPEASVAYSCNVGTGRVLPALFASGGAPRHTEAFQAERQSNRDALVFLVGRLQTDGRRLLVRDTSFLGFPAFTVYVPGLAETELGVAQTAHRQATERMGLRRTLLDLAGSSSVQVTAALATLERIDAMPELYHRRTELVRKLLGIQMDEGSDLADLFSIDYLRALLHARVGNDAAAAGCLAAHLTAEREAGLRSERDDYYWCAAARFRLRADGLAPEQVCRSLAELYSPELAAEVEADLSDPAEVLRYHALPRCGDCGECAAAADCHYPGWLALRDALQRALDAGPIDQTKLADVFALTGR